MRSRRRFWILALWRRRSFSACFFCFSKASCQSASCFFWMGASSATRRAWSEARLFCGVREREGGYGNLRVGGGGVEVAEGGFDAENARSGETGNVHGGAGDHADEEGAADLEGVSELSE